jgi:predicted nuclease of restriction endonuclease-like (RecB) superfamily
MGQLRNNLFRNCPGVMSSGFSRWSKITPQGTSTSSKPSPTVGAEASWKSRSHNNSICGSAKLKTTFPPPSPPSASDLAVQVFKDPYLFDFLGTADPRREAEVEQALVDHIQQFLLELGAGFAFVGRQVHLEVGDEDFYLDLLFYHLKLRRYVVIELKARAFEPGDAGQINLYRSAVDDLLRHPDDQPTIGLLLCKGKNKLLVEYALSGLEQSIAVADWKTQLTETLPPEFQGSLPTIEEIETELSRDIATSGEP